MDTKQIAKFKKYLALAIIAYFGLIQVASAIVRYPVSASLGTGDITSTMIFDGTITGNDISSSASTTMFRLQVSDLSATSTTATSTFSGVLGIGTTTLSNYNDRLVVTATGSGAATGINPVIKIFDGGSAAVSLKMGVVYSSPNYYPGIWLNQASPSVTNYAFLGSGADSIFNTQSGANIYFRINNANKVTLNSSGNLGIGTTSPWTTLSVTGNSDLGNSALAGYFTATSTTATSTFNGGVKLGLSGSGIEFSDGTLQTTAVQTGSTLVTATTTAVQIDNDDGTGARVLFGTYVPANTIKAPSVLKARLYVQSLSCANGFTINALYGGVSFASSTIACDQFNGNTGGGYYEAELIATSTTANQAGWHLLSTNRTTGVNPGTTMFYAYAPTTTPMGWIAVDATQQQAFTITAQWSNSSVNNDLIVRNGTLRIEK